MSFRFAIALSAMVAAAGCSADECTKASEHFTQCLGGTPMTADTTESAENPSPLRCENTYLCSSQCVNISDCATLKAAFNGDPKNGKGFIDCQVKCVSGQ